MLISLTVNDTFHKVEVEPQVFLVDFIRDVLGLTGTKVGCDTGKCGTCVMHVNGRSVKSCTLLAVQANNSEVKTIEGVANHGQMNILQEELWTQHGVQCGFCTPGMIMALLDLLQQKPAPREEEIRSWLEGKLCRCTGYQSIIRAVQEAAKKMQQASETRRVPVTSGSAEWKGA